MVIKKSPKAKTRNINNNIENKSSEIKTEELELQKILLQEFEFEHKRADTYIDRNYRILTIWLSTVAGIFSLGMGKKLDESAIIIIFAVVLPLINLVCAVFFAFNSYANILCGSRAEHLHMAAYLKLRYECTLEEYQKLQNKLNNQLTKSALTEKHKNFIKDVNNYIPKYILSKSFISALTYICMLLLFIFCLVVSFIYAYHSATHKKIIIVLAIIFGIISLIFSFIFIAAILSGEKKRRKPTHR